MWKLKAEFEKPAGWKVALVNDETKQQITFMCICGLLGSSFEKRSDEYIRMQHRAMLCAEVLNIDEYGEGTDEPIPTPEPIGRCKCGAPVYSDFGFCGVCNGRYDTTVTRRSD